MRLIIALLVALGLSASAAQTITNVFLGTTPNDGTGDSLRTAFSKLNTNDTFLQFQIDAIEVGTANQTNIGWAGITNLQSAQLPLSVITNANHLTNWAGFATNGLSALQRGSANLTNWSAITTNVLGNYPTPSGASTGDWLRWDGEAYSWEPMTESVVTNALGWVPSNLPRPTAESEVVAAWDGDAYEWRQLTSNHIAAATDAIYRQSGHYVVAGQNVTFTTNGNAVTIDAAAPDSGITAATATNIAAYQALISTNGIQWVPNATNANTASEAQEAVSIDGGGGAANVYTDLQGYSTVPTWGISLSGTFSGNASGLTNFLASQIGSGAQQGYFLRAGESDQMEFVELTENIITNGLGYGVIADTYVPTATWIASYGPSEGSFLVRDGEDLAWTFDGGSLTNLSLSALQSGSASSGDVLKWNGSAWAPGSDNTSSGGSLDISATAQTTDDTPTYMSLGLGVSSSELAIVNVTILARNSSRTVWGWRHILVVCEGTTVTSIDDVTPNNSNPGPTIGDCSISGGTLRIAITGYAATTIDWKAVGWSTKL